ncbi:MAG TPA: hypothetical protein VF235_05725 [Actinomycetota bacterium]
MVGVRRWFVVIVGVSLACLGILALFQERTFPSAWRADAGPNGIDRALLMDTRGAPLEGEGGRDVRSGPPMGEAAPGYVVRIDASAGREPSLTVRLVSPGRS